MYLMKKINKNEFMELIKLKKIFINNQDVKAEMVLELMKKSKEINLVDEIGGDEKHYNIKISIKETEEFVELLDIRVDIAIEYGENPTTLEEYKQLKKYCSREEVLQCEEIVVLYL